MSEQRPALRVSETGLDGEVRDARDLAALRAGEESAFGRLFERHAGRLHAMVLRMLGGRQDMAEDVVQETFLTLLRKADTFRGEARFATWLTSVALNGARMKLRKDKREPLSLDETAGGIAAPRPVAPIEDVDLSSGALADALDQLPRAQRELLLLVAMGHSYEELSLLLNLGGDQIRGRLYRARQALAVQLERGGMIR